MILLEAEYWETMTKSRCERGSGNGEEKTGWERCPELVEGSEGEAREIFVWATQSQSPDVSVVAIKCPLSFK